MRNHAAMLVSLAEGKAITLRRDAQIAIQPHALRLSILQMSGEPTSLWAWLVTGSWVEQARDSIGDPRDLQSKFDLLFKLTENVIIPYLTRCFEHKVMPQIVMANQNCWRAFKILIDNAVSYIRNESLTSEQRARTLRLNYIVWLLEARPETAQPLVISACDLLSQQFALPLTPHNCQHLGAVLAWIDSRPGASALEQSFSAGEMSAALLMSPDVEDKLAKPVDSLGLARRMIREAEAGGKDAPFTAKRNYRSAWAEIETLIYPELERMHALLENGFKVLSYFPPSEAAELLSRRYVQDFVFNWPKLPGNFARSLRQWKSPLAGATQIRREGVNQSTEALLKSRDVSTQLWSINAGEVAVVQIEELTRENSKVYALLWTAQESIRFRTGEHVEMQHPLISSALIKSKRKADAGYFILVEVGKGIRAVTKLLKDGHDSVIKGTSAVLLSQSRDIDSVRIDAARRMGHTKQVNEHLHKLLAVHSLNAAKAGESTHA